MIAMILNGVYVLDGFFYFFGFLPNPAGKKVEQILKEQPADKIKNDLKRIKADYVRTYKLGHEYGYFTPTHTNFLNN